MVSVFWETLISEIVEPLSDSPGVVVLAGQLGLLISAMPILIPQGPKLLQLFPNGVNQLAKPCGPMVEPCGGYLPLV